jgi:hypothetical protein
MVSPEEAALVNGKEDFGGGDRQKTLRVSNKNPTVRLVGKEPA